MDDDVQVVFMDLPSRVKGFSRQNPDMTHTIVLNSKCCREVQEKTYRHEIEHIKEDDFFSTDSVDNDERRCHDE